MTFPVALRKESVDRNMRGDVSYNIIIKSLSARRAWIEIFDVERLPEPATVALRKESVDRNHVRYTTTTRPSMSLSARRAWIEI